MIETNYLVEFARRFLPDDDDFAREHTAEILKRIKEWGFYKKLIKDMARNALDLEG